MVIVLGIIIIILGGVGIGLILKYIHAERRWRK